MTAHTDLESAVASYQGGAFEYLPKPFDVDDAVALARRAIEQSKDQHTQDREPTNEVSEIIGEAPAMQERLAADLEAWSRRMGALRGAAPPRELGEDERRRLEALGYL